MKTRQGQGFVWLLTAVLLTPQSVQCDIQLAGFGTLGGAVSDQDFGYQHDITHDGTLNRDSVLGFQLDAHLSPAWSVTIQAKAAPSDRRENGWDPTLSWAFLSWRPTNELLLRAGKLRVPLMLYSANSDVGTSFDFARLPTDVYSLSPTSDFTGLSFGWTWLRGAQEWTLEGYAGRAHTDWRIYFRDGIPGYQEPGAYYQGLDVDAGGLVLTLRDKRNTWRIGVHRADAASDVGGFAKTYPYVALGPGLGYYQVLPGMPGPGMRGIEKFINYVFSFSAEIALPNDFELVGEYVRRRVANSRIGPNTNAGYLALLRPTGEWTPYVYVAGIRSTQKSLDFYEALNENKVPDALPGAAMINATQRLGADQVIAYDQYSLAVGTSYNLTPRSKLKAEWAYSRSGRVSSFMDVDPGEESRHRQVNLFSLSYNVSF